MSDVDIDCGDCDCDCDCDCGDCFYGGDDCCCCCCLCPDSDGKSVPDNDTTLCIFFNTGNNSNHRDSSCWCCCCCWEDLSPRRTKTNPNPYANPARSADDDKNKSKFEKEQSKEYADLDPKKSNICSSCGRQLPKNNYGHRFPYQLCPRCQEFQGLRPSFVPPQSQRFEALDREKYLGRGKYSSFYPRK